MTTIPFLLQNITDVLAGKYPLVTTVDTEYFRTWWYNIPPSAAKYTVCQYNSVLSFAVIGFDVLLDEAVIIHSIFVPIEGGQFENYIIFSTCDGFDVSGGKKYQEALLPAELDAEMDRYCAAVETRYMCKLRELNDDYDDVCARTKSWLKEGNY